MGLILCPLLRDLAYRERSGNRPHGACALWCSRSSNAWKPSKRGYARTPPPPVDHQQRIPCRQNVNDGRKRPSDARPVRSLGTLDRSRCWWSPRQPLPFVQTRGPVGHVALPTCGRITPLRFWSVLSYVPRARSGGCPTAGACHVARCAKPPSLRSTAGAPAHQRELIALSSCPTLSSCRLLLSVRMCTGSLFQPASHSGFLMSPTPWTTAEKAVHTREARLETVCRPLALPLLPQQLQPQPAQQPTAHHDALG
jgi:hypothetical protein